MMLLPCPAALIIFFPLHCPARITTSDTHLRFGVSGGERIRKTDLAPSRWHEKERAPARRPCLSVLRRAVLLE
jgi:hypothetical protein